MYTQYTCYTVQRIQTHTHAHAILGTTILTRTKKNMQEQRKNINAQITKTNEYFRKISLIGSGRTKTQERQQQNSFDFECTLIIGEKLLLIFFLVCRRLPSMSECHSFCSLFALLAMHSGSLHLIGWNFSLLNCAFSTILNCTQQLSTFPCERCDEIGRPVPIVL